MFNGVNSQSKHNRVIKLFSLVHVKSMQRSKVQMSFLPFHVSKDYMVSLLMAASVLLNITKNLSCCNCDIRRDGEEITCQSLSGTQIATLPVNGGFKPIAILFAGVVCSIVLKENLNSSSGNGGHQGFS